jgi:hypothetical protein
MRNSRIRCFFAQPTSSRSVGSWARGCAGSFVPLVLLPLLLIATVFMVGMSADPAWPAANAPPRLSKLTVRIGTVYLEGGGTKRGVKGTYRLCDDGPQSSPGRFGLLSITHRSGSSLLVRERSPSITWDTAFEKPECGRVTWSSTIPADLPNMRTSPCYSVTLRVRDPGGLWSNSATRAVTECPRR